MFATNKAAALLHWPKEAIQSCVPQEHNFGLIVLPTSNAESIPELSGCCFCYRTSKLHWEISFAQACVRFLICELLLSVGAQIAL